MGSVSKGNKARVHVQPDERETRWAKRLEWPVLIAAAMVIPVLVLQNENVQGSLKVATHIADYVIWSVFALEVGIMLSVTTDRRRWCRTHALDIIVTIATPPFLMAALEPFQVARLLRLLRLLRLAPIFRKAFSPGGIKTATILSCVSVAAGALIYNSLAHVSFGNGLLISTFALLAGNTGPNKVPEVSSQVATITLRIVGILVVVFFTGAVAERFVRADIEGTAEAEEEAEAARNEALLNELAAIRGDIAQLKAQVSRYADEVGQPASAGRST
jgi:voltage-gated potassium channel